MSKTKILFLFVLYLPNFVYWIAFGPIDAPDRDSSFPICFPSSFTKGASMLTTCGGGVWELYTQAYGGIWVHTDA